MARIRVLFALSLSLVVVGCSNSPVGPDGLSPNRPLPPPLNALSAEESALLGTYSLATVGGVRIPSGYDVTTPITHLPWYTVNYLSGTMHITDDFQERSWRLEQIREVRYWDGSFGARVTSIQGGFWSVAPDGTVTLERMLGTPLVGRFFGGLLTLNDPTINLSLGWAYDS